MDKRTHRGMLAAALMFLGGLVAGCAPEGDPATTDVGASAEALHGSEIEPLPPEVLSRLVRHRELDDSELDEVFMLDHLVAVGPGRRIHVTEAFTVRGWLSWPHRGALLLPGALSTAEFMNLDVDGYRFQEQLAHEGYFAFSVDYEGAGSSTYPASGYDVDHASQVETMRRVLRSIRILRLVPRVDIVGESNGGAVAAELCAERWAARTCVLSSMLYTESTPFFDAVFLDPGFVWFLSNLPDGYIDATPDFYFNIVAGMPPAVAAETLATQPGRYAVGPLLAPVGGLPWFDPTRAAVPGLIIQGTQDNIALQSDADALAAAYGSDPLGGGVATVVRIEGGGHIPRVEPAPINGAWNQAVIDFLAAH